MPPAAIVPMLSFPGLAFAALIKSPSVLYSDWLLATNTRSKVPTIETIAKSFVGSNGRLWKAATLMAVAIGNQRHCIAVGRRGDYGARRSDAAGARHILDHDTLAEFLAKLVGQNTGRDVGNAARTKRQHKLDRLFRPGCLRLRCQRYGKSRQHQQRGSSRDLPKTHFPIARPLHILVRFVIV